MSSKSRCNDIIKFFNDAFENYKSKKVKYKMKNCITKIHMYSAKTINFRLPSSTESITLKIDELNNIYLPLSFILSNLDESQFTNPEPNDYAFKALQLILSILEDYNMFKKETKKKSKKLLGQIKIFSDVVSLMDVGTYRFTIPKKVQLKFNVSGINLATLQVKKLYKVKKNKNS